MDERTETREPKLTPRMQNLIDDMRNGATVSWHPYASGVLVEGPRIATYRAKMLTVYALLAKGLIRPCDRKYILIAEATHG